MKLLPLLVCILFTCKCDASDSVSYTTVIAASGIAIAVPTAVYIFYKKHHIPMENIQAEETPGPDMSAEDIMDQFDIMEVRTDIEIRTGYPNGLSDHTLASLVAEEEKYHMHKAQYWKLIALQRQQELQSREDAFL